MNVGPESEFFYHFKMLALQTPEILMLIVGIVLCLVFMKRHPKPAMLALFGLLLLLLVIPMVEVLFFLETKDMGLGGDGWFSDIIVFGRSVFAAGGYALLVSAVFVGRGQSAGPRHPPHQG